MRSKEEVDRVLALIAKGMNNCEISRATGIPLTTVWKWSVGQIPWIARPDSNGRAQCPICSGDWSGFDRSAYSYLLGQYLGDGWLNKMHRGVFKLSIFSDLRYPRIIEECAAAMLVVMPGNKVGRREKHEAAYPNGGCMDLHSHSKHWACLFPQHGAGPKHKRRIALAEWQQQIATEFPKQLIRGLIHSDGSRYLNAVCNIATQKRYSYVRYEFSNRSQDILKVFCDACDVLGIHWTTMTRWKISVARRNDVALLDEFVGPKA